MRLEGAKKNQKKPRGSAEGPSFNSVVCWEEIWSDSAAATIAAPLWQLKSRVTKPFILSVKAPIWWHPWAE